MDERIDGVGVRDNPPIIQSLLEPPDIKALQRLWASLESPIKFVEVGCYQGGNIPLLTESFNNIRYYAIDIWEEVSDYFKFLNAFKNCPLVVPIRLLSKEAVALFDEGELDMVFIDADHSYPSVLSDLRTWMPKIKKGGILCGHDAEGKYTRYSKEQQDSIMGHLYDEKTEFVCHAGVVKALYDIFNDEYEIYPESRVWYKKL